MIDVIELERKMLEEVERVVKKLTKEEKGRLMRELDHCVLMANKFYETGKPEYYVGMKTSCETFLKTLEKLSEKSNSG